MKNDWPIVPLDTVADVIDSRHKTPQYSVTGYPMVRVVDIKEGPLNLEDTKLVSKEVYDDFSKGRDPEVGDLVISRVGSCGNVSYAVSNDRFCLGQNTAFIIPKDSNRYLYYQLVSSSVRDQMDQLVVGAVQKTISLKSIKQLEVCHPDRPTQERIAGVLGALDDKIHLNQQINQTLESIAQTIFKSWFVDFDPVKAKMEGHEPDGMDTKTAALFPDNLVESELGMIPEGWEWASLKSLSTTISKGTTPNKKQLSDAADLPTIPFIKVKDITKAHELSREGLTLIPESVHRLPLNRSILNEDDLLFSIAGTIGRSSIVDKDLADSNINQAIAFIRLSNPNIHLPLVRLNLMSDRIQNEVQSMVVQGVQANASLKTIGARLILVPKSPLLDMCNSILSPILNLMRQNSSESRTLSHIRDTLLPKLISGEIQIPTE